MTLKSLRIPKKHFTFCEDVSIEFPSVSDEDNAYRLGLLIGPNGSGKSNIFRLLSTKTNNNGNVMHHTENTDGITVTLTGDKNPTYWGDWTPKKTIHTPLDWGNPDHSGWDSSDLSDYYNNMTSKQKETIYQYLADWFPHMTFLKPKQLNRTTTPFFTHEGKTRKKKNSNGTELIKYGLCHAPTSLVHSFKILVSLFLNDDTSRIILLDEPTRCMHPSLERKVLRLLSSKNCPIKNKTLIIITHSRSMIDSRFFAHYYRFSLQKKGTIVCSMKRALEEAASAQPMEHAQIMKKALVEDADDVVTICKKERDSSKREKALQKKEQAHKEMLTYLVEDKTREFSTVADFWGKCVKNYTAIHDYHKLSQIYEQADKEFKESNGTFDEIFSDCQRRKKAFKLYQEMNKGYDNGTLDRLRRTIFDTRSCPELLFAETVLLVEGPTDYYALSSLQILPQKDDLEKPRLSKRWTIIQLYSKNSAPLLIACCKKLRIPCVALLDRDAVSSPTVAKKIYKQLKPKDKLHDETNKAIKQLKDEGVFCWKESYGIEDACGFPKSSISKTCITSFDKSRDERWEQGELCDRKKKDWMKENLRYQMPPQVYDEFMEVTLEEMDSKDKNRSDLRNFLNFAQEKRKDIDTKGAGET